MPNHIRPKQKNGDPLEKLTSIQLNESLTDLMFTDIMGSVKNEGVEEYFQAIRKGDVNRVSDFLESDSLLTVEVDDQMRTALHHACK